jgi:hypothetical protein
MICTLTEEVSREAGENVLLMIMNIILCIIVENSTTLKIFKISQREDMQHI